MTTAAAAPEVSEPRNRVVGAIPQGVTDSHRGRDAVTRWGACGPHPLHRGRASSDFASVLPFGLDTLHVELLLRTAQRFIQITITPHAESYCIGAPDGPG